MALGAQNKTKTKRGATTSFTLLAHDIGLRTHFKSIHILDPAPILVLLVVLRFFLKSVGANSSFRARSTVPGSTPHFTLVRDTRRMVMEVTAMA